MFANEVSSVTYEKHRFQLHLWGSASERNRLETYLQQEDDKGGESSLIWSTEGRIYVS